MRDHIHTGLIPFLYSGLAAILLIHILRAAATLAATRNETAGKALAAFALAD